MVGIDEVTGVDHGRVAGLLEDVVLSSRSVPGSSCHAVSCCFVVVAQAAGTAVKGHARVDVGGGRLQVGVGLARAARGAPVKVRVVVGCGLGLGLLFGAGGVMVGVGC